MKKAVWTAFLAGLVIVNGLALLAEHFTSVVIPMPYRLTIVFGITVITLIFSGAAALVSQADEEIPLTRNDHQRKPEPPHNEKD